MSYFDILNLVFQIIWNVFGLIVIHFVVFVIAGIFAKKRFPATEERLRYGIIISARNEEKVIGKLIESILANEYPREKLEIFVCAHNCTDRTAQIARSYGAHVYEYNNPDECTLGYAYRALIANYIEPEFGTQNFDGFFVFNADNVLRPDYFLRMNEAFVANGKRYAITSFRNSSNFGKNYMSFLYGMFFFATCRFEARGRTVCNCSTRISGTGYLYPAFLIKDGWEYVTMTEDWEFSADQISEGLKIMYCDDAEFFDEQPTTVPVMFRQRLRWGRGHTIVFFTRFKKLMKSLFRPKRRGGHSNKFSVYDSAVSIVPLGVLSILLTVLQLIFLGLAPVFGADAAAVWTQYAINTAIGTAASYLGVFLSGIFLLLLERKRIPKAGVGKTLAALLLWPIFLLLSVILDLFSLFAKNLAWKPIPHAGENDIPARDAAATSAEPVGKVSAKQKKRAREKARPSAQT